VLRSKASGNLAFYVRVCNYSYIIVSRGCGSVKDKEKWRREGSDNGKRPDIEIMFEKIE
jgi:hypothetical protein